MSLFGDETPPTRALFSPTFSDHGTPTLFSDDDDATANWSSSPQQRRNTHDHARSLLTRSNATIPPAYDHIYDALIEAFGGGALPARQAAEMVLDDANVRGETRDRIWGAVVGQKEVLGQEEVWCLLALVGLAGVEGEEVNIDAVDERRHDLPVPKLRVLAPKVIRHAHSEEDLPVVVREQTTPISTEPVRAQSAGVLFQAQQDDDPWGATDTRPHAVEVPETVQQQPELRIHSPPPVSLLSDPQVDSSIAEHEQDDIHAGLRNTGVQRQQSDNWGSSIYDSPGTGAFGPDPGYASGGLGDWHPGLGARHGSYGGLGGNPVNGGRTSTGSEAAAAGSGLERIRNLMKAPEETVTITMLPEKEGMFMFQHRNYQVASTRRNSRVVRRYSDFVWLLDCLHKRYPFRQIPLLPPKRLTVNGHYLTADNTFLERRRRGLTRFANALVRHPILAQEQLVIMFLTVPTELSVWRKQATISISEEFTTTPTPVLDLPLPAETFTTIRSGLRRSADLYINLCTLLDRLEKRYQGVAADYHRFSTALRSLTDASEATYAIDTSDVPALNNGLLAVSAAMNTSRTLLTDESSAYEAGALEDLKTLRDELVTMRELFERVERALGADPIPALKKRIERNEGKGKTEEEREKWKLVVEADKKAILEWKRRSERIRQNVLEELEVFHRGMGGVGKAHSEWARERVKFAELQAEVWRGLLREVEGMPGGE